MLPHFGRMNFPGNLLLQSGQTCLVAIFFRHLGTPTCRRFTAFWASRSTSCFTFDQQKDGRFGAKLEAAPKPPKQVEIYIHIYLEMRNPFQWQWEIEVDRDPLQKNAIIRVVTVTGGSIPIDNHHYPWRNRNFLWEAPIWGKLVSRAEICNSRWSCVCIWWDASSISGHFLHLNKQWFGASKMLNIFANKMS